MHNQPSEASILRSLYEKEMREHEATKLKLSKALKVIERLAEQQAMPDDSWKKEL